MADDQQFCLRWNNHQSTLISVFDTLLENGTLVDCTLAAEGQSLKAHKVVLSACSPYLETLLSEHYEKHPIIIMKDVKFTELKSMMDYMYRGEVNICQDQLGTFLKAAESLQIKGLSENGEGDARDVGSTTTRPPPPKRPPATPAARTDPEQPPAASPAHRPRDGSISPSSRKRRRTRRNSDDANHFDSNSCDLPLTPAQSTPVVPNIPASITSTPIRTPVVKPEINDRLDHNSLPPESGLLKEKIEPAEQLLEPKTEYLEDLNNDDSVEDLTLDDDDEMDMSQMSNMSNMSRPGPSHGTDISNQGFSPWQLGNQSGGNDEVFMAAQEAVNSHRDSQEHTDSIDGRKKRSVTPESSVKSAKKSPSKDADARLQSVVDLTQDNSTPDTVRVPKSLKPNLANITIKAIPLKGSEAKKDSIGCEKTSGGPVKTLIIRSDFQSTKKAQDRIEKHANLTIEKSGTSSKKPSSPQLVVVPSTSISDLKLKECNIVKINKDQILKKAKVITHQRNIAVCSKEGQLNVTKGRKNISMVSLTRCNKPVEESLHEKLLQGTKVCSENVEISTQIDIDTTSDQEIKRNENGEYVCECGTRTSTKLLFLALHGKFCTARKKIQEETAKQMDIEKEIVNKDWSAEPLKTYARFQPQSSPTRNTTTTSLVTAPKSSDTLPAVKSPKLIITRPKKSDGGECFFCKKNVPHLLAHKLVCPAKRCDNCNAFFADDIALHRHQHQVPPCVASEKPRFVMCPYCLESFTAGVYSIHKKTCVPNLKHKSGEFPCKKCNRIYISKAYLERHELRCDIDTVLAEEDVRVSPWDNSPGEVLFSDIGDDTTEIDIKEEEIPDYQCRTLTSVKSDTSYDIFSDEKLADQLGIIVSHDPRVNKLLNCDYEMCTFRTFSSRKLSKHKSNKHGKQKKSSQ